MSILHFHYHMEIAFSEPVWDHVYTLKCLPKTTQNQTIMECSYVVSPSNKIQEGMDSFGNRMLYGTAAEEQSLFTVDVTGRAGMGEGHLSRSVPVFDGRSRQEDISLYRYHTSLTRPEEKIRELLTHCRKETAQLSKGEVYDRACIYMSIVHESLEYCKGITNINTTAEEALVLRSGVCQDYAQLLVALCREDKIPARYVVGMLKGEGESHAWTEVYDHGRWIGLDPTNNVVVEQSHIKISHGRDYRDCSINRGVFRGQANQRQSIWVEVAEEEIENPMLLTGK